MTPPTMPAPRDETEREAVVAVVAKAHADG